MRDGVRLRRQSPTAIRPSVAAMTNMAATIAHSRDPSPPSGSIPKAASIHSGQIGVIAQRAPVAHAKIVATQNRQERVVFFSPSSAGCLFTRMILLSRSSRLSP